MKTTRITDRYYRQLDKTTDEDNQNNIKKIIDSQTK